MTKGTLLAVTTIEGKKVTEKDLHYYEPKNGHGLKHDPFNAIVAPGGTPVPILERLSADISAVVASDAFKDKAKNLGIDAYGNKPVELSAWMRREIARWKDVAIAANIKAD